MSTRVIRHSEQPQYVTKEVSNHGIVVLLFTQKHGAYCAEHYSYGIHAKREEIELLRQLCVVGHWMRHIMTLVMQRVRNIINQTTRHRMT